MTQAPSHSTPPAPQSLVEKLGSRLFPKALFLLILVVVIAAISDLSAADGARILREGPLYAGLIATSAMAWLLFRRGVFSVVGSALLTDLAMTLILLLRLLLHQASVSGTSLFLCVKILATALLFPWGPGLQLITALTTTILYWVVLICWGGPVQPDDRLHQIVAPAIVTLLSYVGSVFWAQVRRDHDEAATRLAEALQHAQRAESEKASLLEIARDIGGTVDLNTVVERLHRHTAAMVSCDSVATFVSDPGGQSFHLVGVHGPVSALRAEAMAASFPRRDDALKHLDTGKSLVGSALDPQGMIAPDILEHFHVRQLVVSPLRVADRFFGGLVALRTEDDSPFAPHEVELLQGIAAQLALVLQVIELYRHEREEAEASTAVAQSARELIAVSGLAALQPRICELVRAALACDAVTLYVPEPDGDKFVAVAATGLPEEHWGTLRSLTIPIAAAEEQLRAATELGIGAWQSTTPQTPETLVDLFAARLGVTQLLRVPLQHAGQTLGILTVCYRGRRQPFSLRQIHTAQSICRLAALVWQNTQLIEQLEHANRIQGDFVATMSHELRTPLNIITGYTDLLLSDDFGALAADQRPPLQRVASSAQELIELVNTTLQVSRLDTGRLAIEVSTFMLTDLIQETVTETRELWDRPGLSVTSRVAEAVDPMISDRAKLKVVLKNLVGNAAKFTEAGEIHIRAETSDGGVRIDVSDSGVGIPAEAMTIIFQRFRQADSSTTRRFGGVGLGLYIVSRLLEMLGGTIRVDSTVGVGSTFSVWVPRQVAQNQAGGRTGFA